MQTLQRLRKAHQIARFVLVWFALSIGVAIASPIVKPQAMELVCSGAGGVTVLVKTDDGTQAVIGLTLDCPLCAPNSAPPPAVARLSAEPLQPLALVLQSFPSARRAPPSAAPPPARGPPTLV